MCGAGLMWKSGDFAPPRGGAAVTRDLPLHEVTGVSERKSSSPTVHRRPLRVRTGVSGSENVAAPSPMAHGSSRARYLFSPAN